MATLLLTLLLYFTAPLTDPDQNSAPTPNTTFQTNGGTGAWSEKL
jgi:hypothetical protein